MPSLLRDVRYGARALRRTPGLVVVAVLALTLGIGLTTTMFSIVYGALMKGLPVPAGRQVVVIRRTDLRYSGSRMPTPILDYEDIRAAQRSFSGMAGFHNGTINVSGAAGSDAAGSGEQAERFDGAWVSANLFRLLRVQPVLGRDFRDGEDVFGGAKVAVIGYRMWQNRYAGARDIVGRTIRVNGQPTTVVGVMPDGFEFPENEQIWVPLDDKRPEKRNDGNWLEIVARLKPGVSLDAANLDVGAIARRLATEHKETNEHVGAEVRAYVDNYIGAEPRRLLYTMLGAVGFVLLIACANVANLLLDRAAHRTKEVGIRTALGASRLAVVRQFLVEALLLSLVGAGLGLAVAHVGITMFNRAIVDTQPPYFIQIGLFPPVLGFTIAVALLATLVSGVLPAVQSSRADINEVLKDESRGASSLHIGRMSKGLVMFEIALSCGLLVAAGLMIKSVAKLRTVEYGFDATNVFTARIGFPASAYPDTLAQARLFEQLESRLAALPGARGAAFASSVPGSGSNGFNFAVEGKSYARDQDYPRTRALIVSAGFFDVVRMRVMEGRALSTSDRAATLPVVLVNQAFVAKYFDGESPVGRRIRTGGADSKEPWMTVVGVVPNSFSGEPDEPFPPTLFMPLAQHHQNFVSILVRSAGSPLALTAQVRDAVAALNPDIPIYRVYTMEDAISRETWFIRVFGTLFMVFGFVALFLASVGLYAVMAFSVSRRTREVGIRMALGAQARDVVRLIVRQGLTQLAVGMTFGLALAYGMSQLIKMLLFGVEPRDPAIFGGVVVVLCLTGIVACLVPARRATAIDPLSALRAE